MTDLLSDSISPPEVTLQASWIGILDGQFHPGSASPSVRSPAAARPRSANGHVEASWASISKPKPREIRPTQIHRSSLSSAATCWDLHVLNFFWGSPSANSSSWRSSPETNLQLRGDPLILKIRSPSHCCPSGSLRIPHALITPSSMAISTAFVLRACPSQTPFVPSLF